ncbi:hypothetical protein HU200_049251 [Digitaria exilis]|uniref:Uncharacterized protein n=1 Tax=Digitaria exilis TaxID=1010633 RepID=A0A835E9W0_9POAL|nr:hypothetical protein HU200_049251 [Digitaria exilis]
MSLFAGVSVVGDGRPPPPASATTVVSVKYSGYHLLVVNGYSRIKEKQEHIASRRFRVGGYRWIIQCYPRGYRPYHIGHTAFYLFLDQGNVVDPVMVQYEFSIVVDHQVQNNDSSCLVRAKNTFKFSSSDPYSSSCLINRDFFETSKHLIKNDSFTIRCDIVMTKDVAITNADAASVPSNRDMLAPDIRQHLAHLLQSGVGADVTFQVGGETFAAHRCVLAARSAVFKAQLFGPMKEGTTAGVIHVSDMDERVFRLLLDFIYSDSVPIVEAEEEAIMWQHLLVAADRYDLPRLWFICEEELCENHINTSTVATILALAEQHQSRVLKEACLDFLNSPANLHDVMVADGLDHVINSCPSVLKELIVKLASLKFDVNPWNTSTSTPSLLEIRSLFRAELFGPMKDAVTSVIRIDGMEAKVFKLLLTFIYDDSVPNMEEEEKNEDDDDVMWQQLLVAADRYGLERLKQMCEMTLCRYINARTVATILALAEEHHCRELKEGCLDFLDFPANLKDVMEAGGLDHLRSSCPSVLIDLIAKLAQLT